MATLVTGGLRKAITDAHQEVESNPSLDEDEVVYQAVLKYQRENGPSDWVLPDPDANWTAHLPYANPNSGI